LPEKYRIDIKLEYKVQSFKRAELQVPVLSFCFACDSKNKYCNREFQASEGNSGLPEGITVIAVKKE